jgi:negative regulator of replication initiation
MRTIRVSEKVWDEIAKRGKFGETPDDVLKRVFNLSPESLNDVVAHKNTIIDRARRRMSARVTDDGYLMVEFLGGQKNKWKLPLKSDKDGIRKVKKLAVEFAENNEASTGQVNAVIKAMTDAEYWTTK